MIFKVLFPKAGCMEKTVRVANIIKHCMHFACIKLHTFCMHACNIFEGVPSNTGKKTIRQSNKNPADFYNFLNRMEVINLKFN